MESFFLTMNNKDKIELTYDDYLNAVSFNNLHNAARDCESNGTIHKESTQKFRMNNLLHIADLHRIVEDGTYEIQKYTDFTLYVPKKRHIKATRIRDRALQKSLCNNGLYVAFTQDFIDGNVACQKGKGMIYGIELLKTYLKDYYKQYGTNLGYWLKLDIKGYFDNTPHCLLKQSVEETIKQEDFIKHVFKIIDSFKDERPLEEIASDPLGERGVHLGSQISQLLQLNYLNDLDHYVTEQLGVKFYVRYMDDIIMLFKSKYAAKRVWKAVEKFLLEKKGLRLNTRKSRIGRLTDNVPFLKILFKLSCSGKVHVRCKNKTYQKEIKRIRKLAYIYFFERENPNKRKRLSLEQFIMHGNCWFGFAQWRCSKGQIRHMRAFYEDIIKEHSEKLKM